MRNAWFILAGLLLPLAGCREKERPVETDPVLHVEMLDIKAFQASVQVKSMDAVTVSYGVAESEAEALAMPLRAETGSTGLSTLVLDLTELLPQTAYVFCARGIGPSGEEGSVKTLTFTTIAAEGEMYPWEKARLRLPYVADMTLIPGPSSHRNPLAWDKERWKSHVSYTDEDGVEHWLFDSFLLIEGQQTGAYGSAGYTYVLTESPVPSAPKELWQQLLDFWFNGGTFAWQESWWGDGVNTFGRWYSGRMVTPSPSFEPTRAPGTA